MVGIGKNITTFGTGHFDRNERSGDRVDDRRHIGLNRIVNAIAIAILSTFDRIAGTITIGISHRDADCRNCWKRNLS